MEGVKLNIPQVGLKNDLTIIFKETKSDNKLYELKTQKDEFIKALRYYTKRKNEIELMNIVYIEESIDYEYINQFISSITSKEIIINDQNYSVFYFLSKKYEYTELREQIEAFISKRPDIENILNDFSTSNDNNTKEEEIDSIKEEIISKNLDICLSNGMMTKIPLKTLNRILNHPNRILKDHHLLYSFVIETIEKYKSKEELNNIDSNDYENIFILPSSLDYNKMTSQEISKLFEVQSGMKNFFNPQNSKEIIQKYISNEEFLINKIDSIEKKINSIEEDQKQKSIQIESTKSNIENIIEQRNISFSQRIEKIDSIEKLLNEKLEKISLKISKHDDSIEELKNVLSSNERKINEIIVKQKTIDNENMNVKSIDCQNGIFQYLFDNCGTNPICKGIVTIEGNSLNQNQQSNLPNIIDPKYNGLWVSEDKENSSIKINFVSSLVKISKYKLFVGNNSNKNHFNSWTLSAITEKNQEIVLDDVSNCNQIKDGQTQVIKDVNCNSLIQSIKLTMKGKSSWNGQPYRMIMKNIELFGSYINNQ